MVEPELSAVVITKDEENNIEECLSSLGWVDEIIVVDNKSSDKTVELAQRLTKKVFLHKSEEFYQAKNFGIKKASGKWILSIDADERVTAELREEIRRVIASSPQEKGFFIPRKNYLGERWLKYGGQYPDYQLRLLKKGVGNFAPHLVHERIQMKGKVGYLKNPLIHYTYKDFSDFVGKINRYTALEAAELGEGSKKVALFNMLYLPLKKFVSTYFIRKGYRDGILGLAVCGLTAFYVFLKLAKIWERREKAESIERRAER